MQIWNAAISCTPAEVVPCGTAGQVRAALATAAARQLPVSVLGGGHDWAGRAIRPGGLVIDLTPMRHVQVTGDIATVGGGARSGDVMAAAQEHGLAVAAGTVGAVGMTGLALGGGYGPLCGTAGLVADTIVGADVVLADGRFVSADQATEPDLYWALRGGGGNFGVVTALRLRLHPVPTVLTAMVLFGWDQAAEVLGGFAVLAADVPDELAMPLSGINMHHFHGAATRIPVTSTSFGLRDEHFMVEIIGSGAAADGADDHEWVALADRELRAHAMPGGYPNLLGSDAEDQIRHAYGPNAPRLIEVKEQYDPGNVFSAIPLPRR